MSTNPRPVIRALVPLLLACNVHMAAAVSADVYPVQVSIFGDGNPLNGVEDDREPVLAGSAGDSAESERYAKAGTIVCDGRIRGTAMVVDTREFAPEFNGAILLSAAHVLYDLDKKRLFRRCDFHYMGWRHGAAYSARIDLASMRKGDFDPAQVTDRVEFGEGDWVFLHLRRTWKNFRPEQGMRVREFSFAQGEAFQQHGGEFRLVAFDSSAGVITRSSNCTVVESGKDDLGGGAWKGQLLDDCDSGDGASGGGIVAVLGQQHYLVGIRNGAHWSEIVYPAARFPSGPPDGAPWDRRLNTNFGRAVDAQLMGALLAMIRSHQN